MGVEDRIDQRLALLIELVHSGHRRVLWSRDKDRRISTLSVMRSWLWGEIKAIVNFGVPSKAVIAEHFGQSPSKAWAQAEATGQPGRVPLLLEASIGEYDFCRTAGPARDGPLAEARRLAAHALGDGGTIPLAALSSHAANRYREEHSEWYDRLDAANVHKSRAAAFTTIGSAQGRDPREPYRIGSAGFQKRDGVVRPRLDLLASRLDDLLAPLYSLPGADTRSREPIQGKWTDIADLIKLLRHGRPELRRPSASLEFPELTGEHVRLAAQRHRIRRRPE
ncbi:MAG: hypothetical protein ABIW83_07415 [Allosphingosinicella sp.]